MQCGSSMTRPSSRTGFDVRRKPFPLTTAILVTVAVAACGSPTEPIAYIDLARRTPLPAAAEVSVVPLRVAVAAIISPEGTAQSYDALAEYLGDSTGRPVELIQRRTYAEVNTLLENGEVDLAFVCTSAYVAGSDGFGLELLAAPQIGGTTAYYSDLIVPVSSAAETFVDLRGGVFAFTDPMSTSGRIYPTFLLQEIGEEPSSFFAETFFTYSHDRAVYAVADGVADGAAVDSLVLDYAIGRDPELAERIKVIHRSPPFGIPPVVVSPDLPVQEKALLSHLLLEMDSDDTGIRVLAGLGIDRFVAVDDALYDDVRDLTALTTVTP